MTDIIQNEFQNEWWEFWKDINVCLMVKDINQPPVSVESVEMIFSGIFLLSLSDMFNWEETW